MRTFAAWSTSLLAFYLLIVRFLRSRRALSLDRKYSSKDSTLTPFAAQKIIHTPEFLDMPFLCRHSQEFALFKTYGIPTISHLLNATKQLTTPACSGKRYTDTEILIATWLACPILGPNSGAPEQDENHELDPRGALAIARTNWLHSHYEISNDDLLYTLSLFVLEPVKWAKLYGLRSFTHIERDALHICWTEIGHRMGIKDIPPSFDALKVWSEAYEQEYMVPDEKNARLANQTIELLLYNVPDVMGLKGLGRRIIICLLEERLRVAMMLPEQPKLFVQTVRNLLRFHGFFCRHFCLPRKKPFYHAIIPNYVPKLHPKCGNSGGLPRMPVEAYANEPWYYPSSTGVKRILENILVAAGLASAKSFPGPHFQSEGYRIEELGPFSFATEGHEEVMRMAETIQGAPVQGPWSLHYAGAGG